jgi:hypothetical protein
MLIVLWPVGWWPTYTVNLLAQAKLWVLAGDWPGKGGVS